MDQEQLVVLLEARVSDFEKRMKRAERTGSESFRRLRGDSRTATRQMEQDTSRMGRSVEQALASASASIGTFGKAFAAGLVGGVVTAAFAGFSANVGQMVREIATLGDEARRSGLDAEEFQQWKFVAEQNRIGIDSLVDGFKELSLRADEFIVTGAGPAAEAFNRIGFSSSELAEALKNPSELMLEIIGRMEDLDRAAQIRIADEIFGGTGGERFVELLGQGEAGLRATIDRAHEVGAVLDEEMIAKAAELDRRFQELTTRVSTFGKTLAVAIGDLPFDIFETRLNELFADDALAQAVLGPELYKALSEARSLTEDQVEAVEQLRNSYSGLEEDARGAAAQIAAAMAEADARGLDDLWEALRVAREEMLGLAEDFSTGEIEGQEFAARMQEVKEKTLAAFSELDRSDQIDFSGIISQVTALGSAIGEVIGLAMGMNQALGAAPVTDDRAAAIAESRAGAYQSPLAPTTSPRPQLPGVDSFGSPNAASSGGGGGGSSALDSLIEELQTEQEILAAWYEESLAMLNGATEAQLEALGGRHEAIERLEQEHQDRLRGIEETGHAASLQGFLGAGSDILGAIGSMNEDAFKMSQAFAAAEAWVSTLQGAAKELEKGTFGFASAAAVIAKGAAFVAAIKSTSPTGSNAGSLGGEGSSASASAPAQQSSVYNLTLQGDVYSASTIESLFDTINEGLKQGHQINVRRA
ncbi:phage tail tape measure protein [Frigidibacter oleivorans]|uniref:phage tail tape measure protein n=1 Tax=Frigidibacter oleivorans TaxID=2487129 RepID=UPI000F8F3858|nr:phage tail tape measure protein [Frigidibacter oleivorans]